MLSTTEENALTLNTFNMKGTDLLNQDFSCEGGNYDLKDGLNNAVVCFGVKTDRPYTEMIQIRVKDGKIFNKNLVAIHLKSRGLDEINNVYYDDEHGGFWID